MLHFLDPLREITTVAVIVRLLFAMICGGAIGIEREHKRRTAGFRTHILICLGAAMTTMVSQFLFREMHLFTDIGRLVRDILHKMGRTPDGLHALVFHERQY